MLRVTIRDRRGPGPSVERRAWRWVKVVAVVVVLAEIVEAVGLV